MKRTLSILLAAAAAIALAPCPARAALTTEGLKAYVKRVGARVDEAKGNLLVTSMAKGKGRVQLRLLNDGERGRLGFYAYGLGNARSAKDQAALYEYLLRSNSDLAIGSFFVDEDHDVGYKFFLNTRDPISYPTFETAYLAMATVIAERGPRIIRLASGGNAEPAAAAPAEAPPAEPAGETPAEERPAEQPPQATNDTIFETSPRPRRASKP